MSLGICSICSPLALPGILKEQEDRARRSILGAADSGHQPVLCNHMGLKSCQGHRMVLVAGRNVVFKESA